MGKRNPLSRQIGRMGGFRVNIGNANQPCIFMLVHTALRAPSHISFSQKRRGISVIVSRASLARIKNVKNKNINAEKSGDVRSAENVGDQVKIF